MAPLRHVRSWVRKKQPDSASPKRILITQRALKKYGGSEFFAIETARALKALGCDVALYCPAPGKLANIVTPSGIPVCETLEAVPFQPDIIHGQHHLPTMAALAYFPRAPAIYCWHGARPWVEQPPVHPRVRFHVVTSARMGPRVTAEFGVPAEQVRTIPNFVDLRRFSRVRTLQDAPKRAVLYGQYGFNTDELAQLEHACEHNGLELDKVGPAYGNPRPRPEYFLPDYDVAFAIGRCALEALACGCAVLPIVPQLAGSLVTQDTFDDWAASNFSPRYYTSANVMDSDWLAAELARITPEDVAAVTAKTRRAHTINQAITAFLDLYDRAMKMPKTANKPAEFAAYLGRVAPQIDRMWGELERSKKENMRLETKVRELEQKNDAAERRIQQLLDRLLKS